MAQTTARIVADYGRWYQDNAQQYLQLPQSNQKSPRPSWVQDSMTVLLCIPHPDDEVFIGALAALLQSQFKARVIVHAYGYGSDPSQQQIRKNELKQSLEHLGFELSNTQNLLDVVQDVSPDLILSPHEEDAHSTHQKVFQEVRLAIRVLNFSGTWIQTGYWSDPTDPNFAFAIPMHLAEKLGSALDFHASQISRNAFAVSLPAYWCNQVRMASERVQGKGSAALPWVYGQMALAFQVEDGKTTKLPAQIWSE